LDFFAGSGTLGHACYELNAEDNGDRRYIVVQLPEPVEVSTFQSLSAITRERLRRAGKGVKRSSSGPKGDLGFRVFKLNSSNIQAWDPDRQDMDATLLRAVEHIKSDRSESDVLCELLLKLGLDLCVPIEEKKIAKKTVHSIGAGTLIACLADRISHEEVEDLAHGIIEWHKALAPASETTVVFRDSAFADDVAKTNITAILQQHGLENVRSL
jgi:adenine-specific DNA-methyltransferase